MDRTSQDMPSLHSRCRSCLLRVTQAKGNTRRGEEAPAAKALVFRFLCSLTVHRKSLAKNTSWELVCHLNTCVICQYMEVQVKTQTKKNKTQNNVWHDTRLNNSLNHTPKKFFKELNSLKRFSIRFSFSKSSLFSCLFWQRSLGSITNWFSGKVYICMHFSSYLYWDAKTGTVFTTGFEIF